MTKGWIRGLRSRKRSQSSQRHASRASYSDLEENLSEVVPPSLPEAKSTALFAQEPTKVPCIGGCVELQEHSKHLLPEEVVLFEPTEEDIFSDLKARHGSRLIFLNTPLSQMEEDAIVALRKEWSSRRGKGRDELPEFVRTSALRIMQHKKFDVSRAMDLVQTCLEERVRRLPLREEDVLPDLTCGAMYWHGRDRNCRPCLVVRIERFAELIKDKERCVRMTIFVLEYAIRFAMVPGRVENWVVLVDFENASDVVSLYQLPSMCLTAKALSQTLESVYCCRMVWVKLLNLPTILSRIVQSVIPTEKRKKVCVVEDPKKELLKFFEPSQLEARYGGIRRDLKGNETYPFRFFPGCRGSTGALRLPTCESGRSATSSNSDSTVDTDSEATGTSLHHLTGRKFHEGHLWDTNVTEHWLGQAAESSLPPNAAQALSRFGRSVEPCRSLERWKDQRQKIPSPPLNRKRIISL